MTRDEIETLLPFLANESLEGEERAAVEAAVAEDTVLAQELAALKGLRASVQAEPVTGPGAFGLARLMRDVEAELPKSASLPTAPTPTGLARLWQVAAVVALLALAIQSYVVWQRPNTTYELAGDGATVGPSLTIAFSEDATEGQIRNLLLDLELEIIGGPSALGLYTVTASDAETLEAARSGLADASIVESVGDD